MDPTSYTLLTIPEAIVEFSYFFPIIHPSPPAGGAFSWPLTPDKAPKAMRKPEKLKMYEDRRIDNYSWLEGRTRDDGINKQVKKHLDEENKYTCEMMSDTKALQEMIVKESRKLMKEDDVTLPRRIGEYYYCEKYSEGKEYAQHYRNSIKEEQELPSYEEMMKPGFTPGPMLLDENERAKDHEYYKLGSFQASEDGNLIAYTEDTKGDENYTVHIINMETPDSAGESLIGPITKNIEWQSNQVLLYKEKDGRKWVHTHGTDQNDDQDYNEWMLQNSTSEEQKRYDNRDNRERYEFFIGPERDSKMTVRHSNKDLIATIRHDKSVTVFETRRIGKHIVTVKRNKNSLSFCTYEPPATRKGIERVVEFKDPTFSVFIEQSQLGPDYLRFSCTSMITPTQVHDYNMVVDEKETSILKDDNVEGFESSNYKAKQVWARIVEDGKNIDIPITFVYKDGLVKEKLEDRVGKNPLLLHGYGSYGKSCYPKFEAARVFLLDQGFVVAVAHVRGGGEKGKRWHDQRKLLEKKNTFNDFIACAKYLIDQKYCHKDKICIEGRSAGGLLVGAALNMRPRLFKAAIAGSPFLDVLTTMLYDSSPITISERKEVGDPRKDKEIYDKMKSYSPYDNIEREPYPPILITAGLNDPRVRFFESAKYVAKLRQMKMNFDPVLFKWDHGGHFRKSGRYARLREDAFHYAFMMKALGLKMPGTV